MTTTHQPTILVALLIAPDGTTELAITAYDNTTGRKRIGVMNQYPTPAGALAFVADAIDKHTLRHDRER